MNRWMGGWVNRLVDGCGWLGENMDGMVSGWVDGWLSG